MRTFNKCCFLILLLNFCTLCSSCKEDDEPVEEEQTYGQAVDLGLSVKWASCNLGATKPEEYGDYYAWGETETKTEYTEENYKYWKNRETGEFADIGHEISGTQYDVVNVKWGNGWRMPTMLELFELQDKCKWEWTTLNGVDGFKVTGSNGNSIFMSATGYYADDCIGRGWYLEYTSSNLVTGLPTGDSWNDFNPTGTYWHNYTIKSMDAMTLENGYGYRYYGYVIRPVRTK